MLAKKEERLCFMEKAASEGSGLSFDGQSLAS
jgi:hypothetical protein